MTFRHARPIFCLISGDLKQPCVLLFLEQATDQVHCSPGREREGGRECDTLVRTTQKTHLVVADAGHKLLQEIVQLAALDEAVAC